MNVPDILLDNVKIFDWFKPLDKVIDVVDKAVVDKDARIEINAELQKAQVGLQRLAQETYIAELQRETIPWVDALHKMGRQILSFTSIIVGGLVLWYLIKSGEELNLETMMALLSMSGPAGIYNFVKGRGHPVKGSE